MSASSSSYMRKWAREHGYTVNERGRIPAEVVEAFNKRKDEEEEPIPEMPEDYKPSGKKKNRYQMCGFCETNHHKMCPGSVRNGANAPNPIWYCQCPDPEHK